MKKTIVVLLAEILVTSLTGCATLSRSDKAMSRELQSHGISKTEVTVKNPGVAGALNILPGFGNFYLAVGTDESDQWLFGFLNLLTWPFSIVWGVPGAVIDANTINKKETVYYYRFDPQGKKQFESLKTQQQ